MSSTMASPDKASRLQQQEAFRALKSYELAHGMPFEEMPSNFCYFGDDETLDLRQWSLIVSDKSMLTIARVCRYYQDCSKKALDLPPEKAKELLKPSLRALLVTRTEGVTDRGLVEVVLASRSLTHLDLSSVPCITDVGLREAAMALGPTLRVLRLNGNGQLRGEAIAVLGDCCPRLTELHLARCSGVKEWALRRVWHGCGGLQVVDLSHCPLVGDQTLREMAAGCRQLRRVNLEEVQQASDVAVLALSHACPDLEALDLSRTNLLFKITDVAFLALGERCPLLQELRAVNCNHITDVGLHWLSNGCLALKMLDLQGCTKIGNPGLRALSEKCHELEHLNLKDARLATDVGVKHLSLGCTKLTHLDLSGMYLISDGVKRDFGAEGLAALSQGCVHLRQLNLSGCFRVCKLSLKALGKGLAALERLALARCPSLTEAGMAEVFRGCSGLTHLDLSECGDCVTDRMLTDMAQHCTRLRTLSLKSCGWFGTAGMKALAKHCKALENLDLTGCVGVDDLGLLALAEAELNPGLKHVNLDGCVHVTDTGLSWLSDTCPTILTLTLKGTGVGLRAVQAVKDVWTWSSLRKTDTEFGMYPFHRLADRRFIHGHAERYRCATKVTALVRGFLASRRVHWLRMEQRKAWVVTKVQTLIRKYLAVVAVMRMRVELQQRNYAATCIQCMYRCWKARRRVERRRAELFLQLCMRMATHVQRVWRGVLGRRRVQSIKEARALLLARQLRGAVDIERVYRGYVSRQRVKALRIEREKQRLRRLRATQLLQRVQRGHVVRIRVGRMRAERRRIAALREASALRIQRLYRGHRARKRVRAKRREKTSRLEVALWGQKHWRGLTTRKAFEEILQQMQLQAEERAALVMQRYWRRGLAYLELRRLKRQQAERRELMGVKAFVVQRLWRGHKARRRVRRLRDDRARWKEMGAQLELQSALRIQTYYRRFRAQTLLRKMRHERKTRWKELQDEKTGRRFYYNKISGEVRRRTPQDVLDLMPRPVCGDCNYFEAVIECANCAEFFCNQCWKRVHNGGKRASHDFRVLYDYYQKRVDYGEGEFPSRWPGDMQQDELNGWRLRVYPARQPAALLGGDWEEYRDDSDPGRPMYYNRLTGESSYAPPQQQQMLPQITAGPQQAQPQQQQQLTPYYQPPVWQKYYDEASMLPYYYNTVTSESTYQRPPDYQSPRGVAAQQQLPAPPTAAGAYGSSGQQYAYNNSTTGSSTAASSLSASLAAGNNNNQVVLAGDPAAAWVAQQDGYGYTYYYNTVTQEATYDTPPTYTQYNAAGGSSIVAI